VTIYLAVLVWGDFDSSWWSIGRTAVGCVGHYHQVTFYLYYKVYRDNYIITAKIFLVMTGCKKIVEPWQTIK